MGSNPGVKIVKFPKRHTLWKDLPKLGKKLADEARGKRKTVWLWGCKTRTKTAKGMIIVSGKNRFDKMMTEAMQIRDKVKGHILLAEYDPKVHEKED